MPAGCAHPLGDETKKATARSDIYIVHSTWWETLNSICHRRRPPQSPHCAPVGVSYFVTLLSFFERLTRSLISGCWWDALGERPGARFKQGDWHRLWCQNNEDHTISRCSQTSIKLSRIPFSTLQPRWIPDVRAVTLMLNNAQEQPLRSNWWRGLLTKLLFYVSLSAHNLTTGASP